MRVLLVDAHPDDGESAAGGTIARLIREGNEVRSIYFAPCTEDPLNEGHLNDHANVSKMLGIYEVISNTMLRNTLEQHKQIIRDILWKLRELYKPYLVLCPTINDYHQDHKAVAECCYTIFRDTSMIFAYEVLRSSMPSFQPNYFVILNSEDVKKKLDALDLYMAQRKARPYCFDRSFFEAHLVMRGCQAKTLWAEGFEFMWGRLD